jgi:predicted nucleic acid-binding protein
MRVLIDSSVWIDYFRSGNQADELDHLIDSNLVVVNDLILTELIPFLRLQNQKALIDIIHDVGKLPMSIDWEQIQKFQFICLKNGINGIGIPDLIIVQNAIQTGSMIFSLDNHFKQMQTYLNVTLY